MMNDDDDNQSISSSTNSDDDYIPSDHHTHRTCSRYAPCNKKNHPHTFDDPTIALCRSNDGQPVRGDLRAVLNEPGHQQKYDGLKWRRICSELGCLTYLNGGVFHENWLCRKHYLLQFPADSSNKSNRFRSTSKKSRISTTRLSTEEINGPKRGDIRIHNDNIRQKYNGKAWRMVCNYSNCQSYVVAYGYCHRHRHNLETHQNRSEILCSLNDILQQNIESELPPTRTISTPKKGDIQLVRQQWNGTKWYALCNYHTQDCSRRSAGFKYAHLCEIHYKESQEKLKERHTPILSSPTVKRKRSTNPDSIRSSNSTPSQSTIDRVQHQPQTERCIQTDLTYPLESNDLRQGCFLVDDDSNDFFRCESPRVMVHVKKEENISGNNKRKVFHDVDSLSLNCKLEITKLEF